MVTEYAVTEVSNVHIAFSKAYMTVKLAHCPYQDTLPLSKFQMGKHFLAQIFVLRKQTFAFASAG
jgi:hypothetical protein